MKLILASLLAVNSTIISCGADSEKEAAPTTQAPAPAPKVEDPKAEEKKGPTKQEEADKRCSWKTGWDKKILVAFSPVNPVTVDGVNYENSEDFYSTKLDELKKRFGDDVVLEATVGFSDITNNNKAYITGTIPNSESKTADFYSGTARLVLDSCETKDFIIKTSKRINLKTKDTYFCFNLMAEGLVKSEFTDNYMTLNNFTTNITSYRCSDTKSGKTL